MPIMTEMSMPAWKSTGPQMLYRSWSGKPNLLR